MSVVGNISAKRLGHPPRAYSSGMIAKLSITQLSLNVASPYFQLHVWNALVAAAPVTFGSALATTSSFIFTPTVVV
jgi:hypothetical protein